MGVSYRVGDRVRFGVDRALGTVTSVSTWTDGTARYYVKRDADGSVYVAQEDWIEPASTFEPTLPPQQVGTRVVVGVVPPENPNAGDTWVDPKAEKTWVFNGRDWLRLTSPGRPSSLVAAPDLSDDERDYLRESLGLPNDTDL